METIGITIEKNNKLVDVVYIVAKSKKDFYEQTKKYEKWSLFAWYHRHKWFK